MLPSCPFGTVFYSCLGVESLVGIYAQAMSHVYPFKPGHYHSSLARICPPKYAIWQLKPLCLNTVNWCISPSESKQKPSNEWIPFCMGFRFSHSHWLFAKICHITVVAKAIKPLFNPFQAIQALLLLYFLLFLLSEIFVHSSGYFSMIPEHFCINFWPVGPPSTHFWSSHLNVLSRCLQALQSLCASLQHFWRLSEQSMRPTNIFSVLWELLWVGLLSCWWYLVIHWLPFQPCLLHSIDSFNTFWTFKPWQLKLKPSQTSVWELSTALSLFRRPSTLTIPRLAPTALTLLPLSVVEILASQIEFCHCLVNLALEPAVSLPTKYYANAVW